MKRKWLFLRSFIAIIAVILFLLFMPSHTTAQQIRVGKGKVTHDKRAGAAGVKVSTRQLSRIDNDLCEIALNNSNNTLWTFHLKQGQSSLDIHVPVFEIDGKTITATVSAFSQKPIIRLRNGVTQYTFSGTLVVNPSVELSILFRVAPDNPIIRFQYALHTTAEHLLSRANGKDNFTYCTTSLKKFTDIKEIRFSEFNEKYHAYTLQEGSVDSRHFEDGYSAMGPMIVFSNQSENFLLSYEHGSQFPNRFLEFQFHPLHEECDATEEK